MSASTAVSGDLKQLSEFCLKSTSLPAQKSHIHPPQCAYHDFPPDADDAAVGAVEAVVVQVVRKNSYTERLASRNPRSCTTG